MACLIPFQTGEIEVLHFSAFYWRRRWGKNVHLTGGVSVSTPGLAITTLRLRGWQLLSRPPVHRSSGQKSKVSVSVANRTERKGLCRMVMVVIYPVNFIIQWLNKIGFQPILRKKRKKIRNSTPQNNSQITGNRCNEEI